MLAALGLHAFLLWLVLQQRVEPFATTSSVAPVIRAKLLLQPSLPVSPETTNRTEKAQPVEQRPLKSTPIMEAALPEPPAVEPEQPPVMAESSVPPVQMIRRALIRQGARTVVKPDQFVPSALDDRLGLLENQNLTAPALLPTLLASNRRVESATQVIGGDQHPVICRKYDSGETDCQSLPAVDPDDPFDPRAIFSIPRR